MDEKGGSAGPAEHYYPAKTAYLAVARMLAGIVVVIGLAVLINSQIASGIAALFVVVFLFYGIRSFLRSQDKIGLSPDGLRIYGWPSKNSDADRANYTELPFANISGLRLAYYSTRRDGEKGWMELVLKTPETKLVVESEIKGFRQIAMTCYAHAKRQGVRLSRASEQNFEVLLGEGVGQRYISQLGKAPNAGADAGVAPDVGIAGVAR